MPQTSTPEDNFKFVLACLHHSLINNGKIDYDAIAKDFEMTKGSAYFRLYNLRKKAGFDTSGSNNKASDGSPATKRGRPRGRADVPQPNKKRNLGAAVAKTVSDDEDELVDDLEDDYEVNEDDASDSDGKTKVKVESKEEE